MSVSPRELVKAMIRRRVARSEKLKAEKANNMDPRQRVMRFLGEFDVSLKSCKSTIEKYWLIDVEPQRLLSDLQRIDPGCGIELVWFGDDMGDIRLEGIRIHWSPAYASQNGHDQEELIDLASLLFS
jgi:hypothetical protein